MDGAIAELCTQVIVDSLRKTNLRSTLVTADADVILLHIKDAPFDE